VEVSMKRRTFISLLALLILVAVGYGVWRYTQKKPVAEGTATPAPQGDGWVNLLDESHVQGWKNTVDDKDIFEIRDNMLHIYGYTIYPLRYVGYMPETFGDFELHLEFRTARKANSGVFLRAQPKDPVYRGFEVQILEDHGKPPNKNSCGAIYDVVSPMFNMSRPAGEWNSFDIRVKGKEVIVNQNGWMVIHTDLGKMTKPLGKFTVPFAELPMEGHLFLQDHGGEIWFRNIYIKRI
jgi:hypothetical protein